MYERLLIVPRWSGRPDDDWYPWLERKLASHKPRLFGTVGALNMPDPDDPTIEAWVGALTELVGTDNALLGQTILVGHSVGCQAIMRYLATLQPGAKVAGVLGVAGWWSVDQPWGSILPWMETPFDVACVRSASAKFHVLIADDDPFTPDFRQNRRLWEERVGATVTVVAGAQHFNGGREPSVLQALTALVGD